MEIEQTPSELNDAPYHSVYYATITDAVDLRAAKLEAVEAWKQSCAKRALEGQTK